MKNAPEESEPRLQHKIITKHVGAFQNMAPGHHILPLPRNIATYNTSRFDLRMSKVWSRARCLALATQVQARPLQMLCQGISCTFALLCARSSRSETLLLQSWKHEVKRLLHRSMPS